MCLRIAYVFMAVGIAFSDSARILAVVPYNGRSHFIVMEPLFLALAGRGHDVTVVSTFPQKSPVQNYHDIDMSHILPTAVNSYNFTFIREAMKDIPGVIDIIIKIGVRVCDIIFQQKEIQDLINTPVKYDVIITEVFGSDCFASFAHKLNIPLISMVTSASIPWASLRTGDPDNPSYVASYVVDYSQQMSLYERMSNAFWLLYANIVYRLYSDHPSSGIARKYFGADLPPVEDIVQKTSLVLVNSHFSLTQSKPFASNVIEVGGIHIRQQKPLPKDLQSILDTSESGAVLVSFGSLVRATTLPESTLYTLLHVFSQFPHRFILKYEGELSGKPDNVVIRKWLPQGDIIGHKNIKAVITHGGMASCFEVITAGVPIIGIPMFADQKLNIKSIVRKGAGLWLEFDDINNVTLFNALNAVLHDSRYREAAKSLSERFLDRPLSAIDTAVYWTEYVIRHKGAYHLRSAGADLPLYKYLLLDVIAIWLLLFIVCVYLMYRIIFACVNFVFRRFQSDVKEKTN